MEPESLESKGLGIPRVYKKIRRMCEMRKMIIVLLVLSLIAGLVVACGNRDPAPAAEEPAAEEPTVEEPTDEEPETDTPAPADDGDYDFVIGFANIADTNEVAIELGDFLVSEFEKQRIRVIRVDNNFDGATAVRNMEFLMTMDVDGVVQFNVDESVAPVIMSMADEAGIPVIAIDIPHPGATFFGADNQYAGELAGEFMAQRAIERWDGQIDALLLIDQMASGDLPRRRIFGAIDGIRNVMGEFDEDRVFVVEGLQDPATAQRVTADFLSANPDLEHILILPLQMDAWLGAKAAVEIAGREEHVMLMAQNEDFFVEHARNFPEEDFLIGAVCFFLTRYGYWIAPAMRSILDGNPAPDFVYVDHVVVHRGNIDEIFPLD